MQADLEARRRNSVSSGFAETRYDENPWAAARPTDRSRSRPTGNANERPISKVVKDAATISVSCNSAAIRINALRDHAQDQANICSEDGRRAIGDRAPLHHGGSRVQRKRNQATQLREGSVKYPLVEQLGSQMHLRDLHQSRDVRAVLGAWTRDQPACAFMRSLSDHHEDECRMPEHRRRNAGAQSSSIRVTARQVPHGLAERPERHQGQRPPDSGPADDHASAAADICAQMLRAHDRVQSSATLRYLVLSPHRCSEAEVALPIRLVVASQDQKGIKNARRNDLCAKPSSKLSSTVFRCRRNGDQIVPPGLGEPLVQAYAQDQSEPRLEIHRESATPRRRTRPLSSPVP